MANKTLSVVIPTFNEEDYIKPCLEAVFSQTVLPDEVIVVDNNSTDKTLDIVSKFKGVKIIKEKQQGQVFARKTGFSAVKSDWIASLDADTIIDSNWIEECKIYASPNHQAFSTPAYTTEGSFSRFSSVVGNFAFFTLFKIISGKHVLLGSNTVISKEVWLAVRDDLSMRTDLWEDYEIGLLAYRNGYKTSYLRTTKAQISNRITMLTIKQRHTRLMGGVKTYWRYNKLTSIILIPISWLILGGSLVLSMIVGIKKQAKKRYHPW